MAFRISRVVCILGRPVASGRGRWGSRQLHSGSERSLWYAFLMLGILPSEHLRTPFQTVSRRSSSQNSSSTSFRSEAAPLGVGKVALVCFSHARYPTERAPQNPFSDSFKAK